MKRVVIVAKGEVQRVGYRDEVERIARKRKISGFVENITPYDIRIVAEGEDDNIDQFIEQIKIKKYPIDVEDIEVSFENFKGEFEYFEIQGEKSVQQGEKSVELADESVSIGHAMLEKQDDTLTEIRGLREDMKTYMEERFDRIEQEITGIKVKIGMF